MTEESPVFTGSVIALPEKVLLIVIFECGSIFLKTGERKADYAVMNDFTCVATCPWPQSLIPGTPQRTYL
jgi:hypothetical protein